MHYAQFFQKSAIGPELIEACGDRSVIVLDGRSSTYTHLRIAKEECAKRGYLAYQLFSGESFTRSSPSTGIFNVKD